MTKNRYFFAMPRNYMTPAERERQEMIDKYPCPDCDGEGSRTIPMMSPRYGYHDREKECESCEGTGYIQDEDVRAEMDAEREQEAREAADWCCENCGEYGDGEPPAECPACDDGVINTKDKK